MTDGQSGTGDFGPKFMLQEHSRIIDAYHDLHVQKNELLKFYLAFVSIPLSVVALFLSLSRFVPSGNSTANPTPASVSGQPLPGTAPTNAMPGSVSSQPAPAATAQTNVTPGSTQPVPAASSRTNATQGPASGQPASQTQDVNQPPGLVGSLQEAATYLSILLVPIGFAVINTMLNIRTEQYLYVQTVNATRNYFKTQEKIDKKYLVLPFDPKKIEFGGNEAIGRTFWEAMIVSTPTSLLLGFLVFEHVQVVRMMGNWGWFLCASITFVLLSGFVSLVIKVKIHGLEKRIDEILKEDPLAPPATAATGGTAGRPPSG